MPGYVPVNKSLRRKKPNDFESKKLPFNANLANKMGIKENEKSVHKAAKNIGMIGQ